ncbi:hypothetical protein HMI56_007187 [Coelomomyces lativittatus]|nr:hypothetical protein HMI56_007187 [Coelomomyces lativittatus]
MDWCACGDVARFLKLKAVRHGGEEASLDQLHSSVIQLAQGMQLILEDMALGGVWGGIHPLIAIYFLGQLGPRIFKSTFFNAPRLKTSKSTPSSPSTLTFH